MSTDTFRSEMYRELISKYGSYDDIDEKYKILFMPTYQVGIEGFKQQCEIIKQKIVTWIDRAIKGAQYNFHAINILQGVHLNPETITKITSKANNKVLVFLNPSKKVLRARIISRWEREWGLFSPEVQVRSNELFETNYSIQEFLASSANHQQIPVINSGNREEILEQFAEILTNALENNDKKKTNNRNLKPTKLFLYLG